MYRHIDSSSWSPFVSKYLTEGYRKEKYMLEDIYMSTNSIKANVHVVDTFVSPDSGYFHFTVPMTMLAVSQLAIIYACIDCDLAEKRGEIYMRRFSIVCRKEITDTLVPVLLSERGKKEVDGGIVYDGELTVGDDAFTGRASFVMPA